MVSTKYISNYASREDILTAVKAINSELDSKFKDSESEMLIRTRGAFGKELDYIEPSGATGV